MKIAVAASGNTMKSKLDYCFSKCSYFMVYDTESEKIDFIRNTVGYFSINVGKEIIKLLSKHQIEKIISVKFGIKSIKAAEKIKIKTQIINDETINMSQIIKIIN
ncbi:MAG TPA: NifB/NifX family molybdenum-iron cluster-binding protein [Bacteroidales bacterium]|nr:NifB/NifX family molybdenum-iron cluster-binding protein [Bacteroidales bacterium]